LPTHFHDEEQLTFVLAGRRRFLLPDGPVDVGPGHALLIPARVPHRSLPDPSEVVSFNAYLPERGYSASGICHDLRALWRQAGRMPWTKVIDIIGDHSRSGEERFGCRPAGTAVTVQSGPRPSVRRLAAAAGMSREGYSRKFLRRYGMSPHAYLLACRLNEARGLLRAGVSIAEAAAICGFADQSHLGRWFRRTFGITPGRYRRGRGGVTNLPDVSA
jgi:AraC-like DNA-binding protein